VYRGSFSGGKICEEGKSGPTSKQDASQVRVKVYSKKRRSYMTQCCKTIPLELTLKCNKNFAF
jgi:hypothetical protein